MREFCVDPQAVRKNRLDDNKIKVPARGEYYMASIEYCWTDYWDEQTCSAMSRYNIDYDLGNSKPISCSKRFEEEPIYFNNMRSSIEQESATLSEMKKMLKWALNCFGKIPAKLCDKN
jgi:hypothetical protein